jgi:hypothetical protein
MFALSEMSSGSVFVISVDVGVCSFVYSVYVRVLHF